MTKHVNETDEQYNARIKARPGETEAQRAARVAASPQSDTEKQRSDRVARENAERSANKPDAA